VWAAAAAAAWRLPLRRPAMRVSNIIQSGTGLGAPVNFTCAAAGFDDGLNF
jgi:hypothetical protein